MNIFFKKIDIYFLKKLIYIKHKQFDNNKKITNKMSDKQCPRFGKKCRYGNRCRHILSYQQKQDKIWDKMHKYKFSPMEAPKPPRYLGEPFSNCGYCKHGVLFSSYRLWKLQDINVKYKTKFVMTVYPEDPDRYFESQDFDFDMGDVLEQSRILQVPHKFKVEMDKHLTEIKQGRLLKKYPDLTEEVYDKWLQTLVPGNLEKPKIPGKNYFLGIVQGFDNYECKIESVIKSNNPVVQPFSNAYWFERWPTEEEVISMLIWIDSFSFGVPLNSHAHGN